MTGFEIFWPILAQVFLVYTLYGLLRLRRVKLRGDGKLTEEATGSGAGEPPESQNVKRCIANQFEAPVLFYLCCVLLYITEADSLPAVVLAWVFVATRYAHAFVMVTSNRQSLRYPAFLVGFATMGLMWIWLGVWMVNS